MLRDPGNARRPTNRGKGGGGRPVSPRIVLVLLAAEGLMLDLFTLELNLGG